MSEEVTKFSKPCQSSPTEVSVYKSLFLAPSTFKDRNKFLDKTEGMKKIDRETIYKEYQS